MKKSKVQFDTNLIDNVQSLEWIARHLGMGLYIGKHPSQKLGSGMEFNQFRPYVQGDDIRLLDWKMYARTGKYYVKLSTIDVDHSLSMHLDNSPSMNYEEDGLSKLKLAKVITATLTYVMARQGDKFRWHSGTGDYSFGQSTMQWRTSLIPLFNLKTDTAHQKNAPAPNGVEVWLTDLYLDFEETEKMILSFLGKNKELVIFHLIGNREEQLEFGSNTKFVDLETSEEVQVNSLEYAREYRMKLESHFARVRRFCTERGIIYQKVYLQSNISELLVDFLLKYNYLSAI